MRQFVTSDIKFCLTNNWICTKINSKILWLGLPENFSFATYNSNNDSSFWKKSSFESKKVKCIKRLQISKVENFPKANFNLNQICKVVLKQTHLIWNLNETGSRYIFVKVWRNALKLKKISKNWDSTELWSKICLLRQSGTTCLEQSNEIL